jgi:hypothetical protein
MFLCYRIEGERFDILKGDENRGVGEISVFKKLVV